MRHGLKFKNIVLSCTAALLAIASGPAAASPSILIDAQSGAVIEHEEAFKRWYPASLTKLMTAYVTFRALEAGELELSSPVKMSKNSASEPPSKMGYGPGQVVTVDNALKMLAVKSANDIATAIAENVGGTERLFVQRMNTEAHRLGMNYTHFVNAHGLHDSEQYTTARDLAVLVRAIRTEFPQYAHYFAIEGLRAGKAKIETNVVLLGRFEGADGMKTGFICASGFNLIGSATRGGRTLVAVVLGASSAESRAEKAAALLAKGFGVTNTSATLTSLQPYGEDRDQATDLREEICNQKAVSERWKARDPKGKLVFHSPYMKELTREPHLVAVGPGGATGRIPFAMLQGYADVPIPQWRPDRPAPSVGTVMQGDAASSVQ